MIETKMLAELKQLFPYIMFEGIETSTTLGFPDILYGFENTMGMIELKELNRIPIRKFKTPWRPGQLAWYTRFRKKNMSPYVLVLTLMNSWYFITDIKENYTMDEIQQYYISITDELKYNKDIILDVLFSIS